MEMKPICSINDCDLKSASSLTLILNAEVMEVLEPGAEQDLHVCTY